MEKKIKIVTILLSLAGLAVSLYLTNLKLTDNIYSCNFGECDVVQNSKYAEILGIPVAAFGTAFYAFLLVLIISNLKKFAQVWVLGGLLFSMYLTIVELFVIHAICGWCVTSFVIVILLSFLIFKEE